MKKVMVLMLTAMVALALTACGDTPEQGASSASGTAQVSSEINAEESSSADGVSSEAAAGQTESSKAPAKASSAPASVSSKAPAKTSSTPKATSSAASPATGKFKSITEYLNDPTVKAALDALLKQQEELGLNMEVSGEGNKLIYSYTYKEQMPAEISDALNAAMEAQRATMEQVATELKAAVEVDNPVVVVKYINADGTLLTTIEFQAK